MEKVQESVLDNLEPGIVMDILSRLPIHSLFQCRRVCRNWHRIIRSHEFILTHFTRSFLTDNRERKMINESDISFIACVEDSSMCVTNLYFVQLGMPRKTSIINCHFDTLGLHEGWFQVVGSCNGLLCIKGYGNVFNSFYVCNPITREFMILPDNTVVSNGGMANYGGFGFDAATGEYKVVFMYYAHAIGLGQQQGHEPVKTYMLTLGTTAWEYIGEAPAQPYRNSCVLVNGALHWRTRPRNKSGVYIVAFDIASKEFAVVPPPPIRHVLDAFDWTLCNLGGHLAVVTFDRARISNVVNVWEMSEYKVESSWHKTEVPELKYGPLKVDVGLLPESLHPSLTMPSLSSHGSHVIPMYLSMWGASFPPWMPSNFIRSDEGQ